MQEMVIHSQAKHLVREAVIGRFEPHLYHIDIPYVNVNEVFLPVLIKNHWTLYVYDLEKENPTARFSSGRKKTMLSGVQQNRLSCGWRPQKEVSPYDLRTFNFITPDVPLQTNECIYGHPRNRSRWTRGSESMKGSTGRDCLAAIGQPVEHFFSRSRTPYWMRESAFWHPRPEIDRSSICGRPVHGVLINPLDERECILAPSSGVRPVAKFRSTGSRRLGQNFKCLKFFKYWQNDC
ncbi:hypothetical protein AAG906_028047 [Vitis piasezkii]